VLHPEAHAEEEVGAGGRQEPKQLDALGVEVRHGHHVERLAQYPLRDLAHAAHLAARRRTEKRQQPAPVEGHRALPVGLVHVRGHLGNHKGGPDPRRAREARRREHLGPELSNHGRDLGIAKSIARRASSRRRNDRRLGRLSRGHGRCEPRRGPLCIEEPGKVQLRLVE